MPSLQDLLEQLAKLNIHPDDIKVRAPEYGAFVEQAASLVDEDDDDDDQCGCS